jgi:hypothetical protein
MRESLMGQNKQTCIGSHDQGFPTIIVWLKMFHRNTQPSSSSHADPRAEFQDDAVDLVAEGLCGARRIARLLNKATKAGVKGINPKIRKAKGRNHARAVQRNQLKYRKWPDYYWFECRLNDRRTDEEFSDTIPIHLPSEILEVLWDLGAADVLLSETNLDTNGKKHMAWMREQLDTEKLLGWGLHGDGIPCNYDRTESVIMISLNLPGVPGKQGRMRIPLVVLPDFAVSENTYDDIMEVIAWSMRHLLSGTRPNCRHDCSAFNDTDRAREKKTGNLPFKSCLVQARGDWDWMGKCYHFPFHNVIEGCCWLCNCKRHQVHTCHFLTCIVPIYQ